LVVDATAGTGKGQVADGEGLMAKFACRIGKDADVRVFGFSGSFSGKIVREKACPLTPSSPHAWP